MNFEDMKNPELQEKVKACETLEELLALAREQGPLLRNGGKDDGGTRHNAT